MATPETQGRRPGAIWHDSPYQPSCPVFTSWAGLACFALFLSPVRCTVSAFGSGLAYICAFKPTKERGNMGFLGQMGVAGPLEGAGAMVIRTVMERLVHS